MHHSPNWFVMILNTSLHGDISIGFQNIPMIIQEPWSLLFSLHMLRHAFSVPSLWEAWQVAPSKVSWHRWPLPSIWSYLKGTLCGAEPHPAPACTGGLGGQFNQFNHFGFTLVTYQVLNWKPHDGDRCVWGFRNARYLHVVTVALYTTGASPRLPSPARKKFTKTLQSIWWYPVASQSPKEWREWLSFFENVPSDSTVLRPAIQRKWTE